MFTHNSNEPVITFRGPDEQPVDKKPNGLWFAEDTSWLDFCRREQSLSEMFDEELGRERADKGMNPCDVGSYHHYLDVDISKIAVLDTFEKLSRFTDEFTYQGSGRMSQMKAMMGMGIDWSEVAKKYDGIFIPQAAMQEVAGTTLPMKMNWLSTYDAGSGCVWNKDAIKECRRCTPEEMKQLGVEPATMAEKVSKRPSQWSATLGD